MTPRSNTAMQFGDKAYPKDPDDWYVEPTWTVEAFADHEPITGLVWDPACGCGTIPRVFEQRGNGAFASDIVDRGYERLNVVGSFFSDWPWEPESSNLSPPENVVTNPPYTLAQKFAERALQMATRKVCLLVSLTFLESQTRKPFFTEYPPLRVWVCSKRPSMPPGDKLQSGEAVAKGGKRPYCWIVWQVGYRGVTELRWL